MLENMESFAQHYGDSIDVSIDNEQLKLHNFPSYSQVIGTVETMKDDLKGRGFGFQLPVLVSALEHLKELGGMDYLEKLRRKSGKKAYEKLLAINQIGWLCELL